MKRFLIAAIAVLLGFSLKSQTSQDFVPIVSKGQFPEIYADYLKLKNPKDKDSRTYHIQLIQNGRVIYGTILNEYIDKIVDELLKNDPKLREQIQCYILNSTDVNAFSTKEGILYVNLGLLAQVSNEAELAFVLGHEIAHYACKHIVARDQFQKQNRKNRQKKVFQYLDYRNYSRENEFEADKLSFDNYYKQSVYNPKLIDGTFDVLQYYYLPFDEKTFNKDIFETHFYTFPDHYALATLNPIRAREDYIDTLSTHPNLQKRRALIEKTIRIASTDGKTDFMQEKALFEEVRKLARLECIHIYLTEHDYVNAYYNSFILKDLYPDMPFLDIAIATSIYGMAKHRIDGSFLGNIIDNYKNKEGDIQQVYYFFSKLSKQELSVLALRELWKTHLQYPDNEYITKLCKDIAKKVVGHNKLDYTKFSDYPMTTNPEDIESIQINDNEIDTTSSNKYQKIKSKSKNLQKVLPNSKFKTVNYMLVDLRKDSRFLDLMWDAEANIEDEKILNSIQNVTGEVIKANELIFPGVYYGVSFYSSISYEKASNFLLKKQKFYNKLVKNTTQKLKFEVMDIREQAHLKDCNTQSYNQLSKIISISKDYRYYRNIDAVLYQCYDLSAIQDELLNKKILFLSIHSSSDYTFRLWGISYFITLGIVFPYALLLPTINAVIPEYDIECLFGVLSLEEGKTVFVDKYSVSEQCGQAYMSAYIYDMLYKMKKGVKK